MATAEEFRIEQERNRLGDIQEERIRQIEEEGKIQAQKEETFRKSLIEESSRTQDIIRQQAQVQREELDILGEQRLDITGERAARRAGQSSLEAQAINQELLSQFAQKQELGVQEEAAIEQVQRLTELPIQEILSLVASVVNISPF